MESWCFDRDSRKCSSAGIWDTRCWFQPCPILYVTTRDILTPQVHYKATTPKRAGPNVSKHRSCRSAARPAVVTAVCRHSCLHQSLNHNEGTCNCLWLSEGGLTKKLHKQETIKHHDSLVKLSSYSDHGLSFSWKLEVCPTLPPSVHINLVFHLFWGTTTSTTTSLFVTILYDQA